jgi:hypothetical protein
VLSKNCIQQLEGHDATVEEVWHSLTQQMTNDFASVMRYVSEMSSFPKLSRHDIGVILKHSFLIMYGLLVMRLYIKGQFYFRLYGGIIYSREWTRKLMGKIIFILEEYFRLFIF